jgi:phosphate-selective porin OprO and OprP
MNRRMRRDRIARKDIKKPDRSSTTPLHRFNAVVTDVKPGGGTLSLMPGFSLAVLNAMIRQVVAAVFTVTALVACTPSARAQAPPQDGPPVTLDVRLSPADRSRPLSTRRTQAGGEIKDPSIYDKIWKFTEWYSDESNPIVQKVLFSGRYQHEFATIDSEEGDLDEWNVRRMRLGPRMTLFRALTLHAEVELNPQEHDPLYMRFTDFYVQWVKSDRVTVTAGKQGVPFTMDGATSSKDLITIDRSNLTNNMWFPQEYMPGVSLSGKIARWSYRGGVYSSGEMNREFGEFSGGAFTLALLGYDFGPALGVREALLTGNYVYQHPDADNTFTRRLENVASVNLKLEAGRWGLRTDVSAATGYLGQGDLWGFYAMPFLNITDKFQLVTRYTILDSQGPNGVLLATYENRVVGGRGDLYNEGYLGANYYFYGHKLKLQSGLQYADMSDSANDGGDYSGLSWTSGIRIGW